MNIVLLGGPGAGKGTLANYLASELGFNVLTTGAMYRKEAEDRTDFGLKAKEYWGNGNLCPNEMTNELMRRSVNRFENKDNFVFDGYPRNVNQAEYLDSISHVDLVIDISVDEDVAVKRLLKRATIENRPDDTEDIIRNRFKVYHNNNVELVGYYSSKPYYHVVNGEGTPEDTNKIVDGILKGL